MSLVQGGGAGNGLASRQPESPVLNRPAHPGPFESERVLTVGDDMFKYETTTLTRDYWRYTFAGQAMQGKLAMLTERLSVQGADELAGIAVKCADALLLELEKQGDHDA